MCSRKVSIIALENAMRRIEIVYYNRCFDIHAGNDEWKLFDVKVRMESTTNVGIRAPMQYLLLRRSFELSCETL